MQPDNVQVIRKACVDADPSIIEEGTIIRDITLKDVLNAAQALEMKRRVRDQLVRKEIIEKWDYKSDLLSGQDQKRIDLIAKFFKKDYKFNR